MSQISFHEQHILFHKCYLGTHKTIYTYIEGTWRSNQQKVLLVIV